MNKKIFSHLTSLFALVGVTACGGGGGTTPVTKPDPIVLTCTNGAKDYPTCTPPVIPGNLQLTVPAPTYVAGSIELQAFNEWNDVRQKMGLGLLKQDANLDRAAQAHANYMVLNKVFQHEEDPSKAGFTGITPKDRSLAAGYGYGAGEGLSGTSEMYTKISPFANQMNTVYHRSGVLYQGARDAAVAVSGILFAPDTKAVVFTSGHKNNPQTVASDYKAHYPLTNQACVLLSMSAETPNPFPDIPKAKDSILTDFANNTSYPISYHIASGRELVVTSFTVTESGSTVPLEMRSLNHANSGPNFPNGGPGVIDSHEAYVVGKKPFKQNTTYQVKFEGRNNGAAFTDSWNFSTCN